MALKDKDIIESIKEGKNTQILEDLYEKVLPKISKYICKNSGNKDDAFDIFQDGVIIFYKYIITGRFREEFEISGFLYTVCKNLWINKVKHDKMLIRIEEKHESTDNYENILDFIITKEREEEVRRLLMKLGEKCRKLLQYVFFYQLSTKEICEKMGFSSADTLKTKKYKCKKQLLEIINNSRN
jgi:RNA polymerase sigma factor (sigma-70 family)